MGPEREYLSVTIPVHPCFLPKSAVNNKKAAYINTILLALTKYPDGVSIYKNIVCISL